MFLKAYIQSLRLGVLGLMGGSVVVVFWGGVVGVFFSQRQGLADCFFVSFFSLVRGWGLVIYF